MNTTEFDTQIADLTLTQTEQILAMDDLQKEIIESYTVLLQEDFPVFVKNEIIKNPSIVQSIGNERLGDLKKELNQLYGNLPVIVNEQLSKDELWEYKKDFPKGGIDKASTAHFETTSGAGKELTAARKKLMGYLGQIMRKYGLINSLSPDWESHSSRPAYKLGLDWSSGQAKSVANLITKYKVLFGKFIDTSQDKFVVQKKKEEAIALSLWDEA